MPKNTKGGKKFKKAKGIPTFTRQIIYANEAKIELLKEINNHKNK